MTTRGQFLLALDTAAELQPTATPDLHLPGRNAEPRGHAFVATPVAKDFDDVFHYGISPPIRSRGMLCVRLDKMPFAGDIVSRIKHEIRTARLVIADLTHANANVYLEVGYAWGCGIPTVLLCQVEAKLEFDVAGQRCIRYGNIRELEEKLHLELSELLR